MPRVLTVDDSRAVRSIVSKHLTEWGIDVDEAEDGNFGLEKLEEIEYDLVLLDVTMPNMDGPTMLAKMRESGNKTPVLMLTSESKRSIIATALKLGIEDYILKPFKAEELKTKVFKVIKTEDVAVVVPSTPAASSGGGGSAGSAEAGDGGKKFIDIMVIDDMENVHKKLRSLLPPHVTMNGANSAQAALNMARDRVFRVILIDNVIPDVSSTALMNQLRALQSHASYLSLCLRTSNSAEEEAKNEGYDGVLFKPFSKETVDDFLLRYFDNQEVLTVEDNKIRVGAFTGKADRIDKYFEQLGKLVKQQMEKIAEACYEDIVFDAHDMPVKPDKSVRLMCRVAEESTRLGLELRVLGAAELGKLLREFTDTASIPFEARA